MNAVLKRLGVAAAGFGALLLSGVAMAGSVASVVLSITPPSVNFGALLPGQASSPQVVTITNTSLTDTANLISGIFVPATPEWTSTATTCGSTLGPTQSCTYTFQFRGSTPGTYTNAPVFNCTTAVSQAIAGLSITCNGTTQLFNRFLANVVSGVVPAMTPAGLTALFAAVLGIGLWGGLRRKTRNN